MSFEPGGVPIGSIEIDGTDSSSGAYLYPTAFDATTAIGSAGGVLGSAVIYPAMIVIGTFGVSDIFYVAPDTAPFAIAADSDTFTVAPGRTN